MVLPVEIKASRQGSMQILWNFMHPHNLYDAIRSSLEPFGEFVYYDSKAGDAERHVDTIPLYAHIIVRTSRPPVLLPRKSGTLVQRSLVIFSLAMLNISVKAVFSRR